MRQTKVFLGFSAVLLLCSTLCPAQRLAPNPGPTAAKVGHLGNVRFPVSCSSEVQKGFEMSVALLHSFQYEEAGKAFSEVAQQDPNCAMAYWGLAMSLYQQLWNFPDAATLKKGYKDVEKAQKAGAETDREHEYIAAAAAFYQNDPKLSQTARTEAYSKAMEELYERRPADVNAGAFYALSLVALAQDGVNNLQNRKHAIAILDKLFSTHPGNPGVDHYLIHASDDPRLASFGLAAARNYAKIAPDSAHALHMPSHIFTRLGLWQDSIHSNIASAAAAERATKSGRDNERTYQIHALTFLEYAYLQSGQRAAARRVIEEVRKVPDDSAIDLAENQALFEVTYAIENHEWKVASALTLPVADRYPGDREEIYRGRTIGAARSGDVVGARQDFQKLKETYAAAGLDTKEKGSTPTSGESVAQMEAEAWLDAAEGHHDQAVETMRAAAT